MVNESFTHLVSAINAEYPHDVELPMSHGFISIIGWLEEMGIKEYEHYSFLRDNRPYIVYSFKREADAVLFAMRWS